MALITTADARRPLGGPDLALQVCTGGHLGAALIAAGLMIIFTDRAAGVVTVAVDCSKLGWLMLTVAGLAHTLPPMLTSLVKLTGLGPSICPPTRASPQ
jgi:hypothetical protein